ncbi:MAG: hypothetical protein NTV30_00960 [Chloroflexi bacterium]|nr:hypothetical protein [Chloroflexota bacterium]
MKKYRWQIFFIIGLILISVTLYMIQFFIFGRSRDILFYIFQDLAFLPLNVLLVVVILERLLVQREKQNRLEKMNMVIGVFFSEIGTGLLTYISNRDLKIDQIRKDMLITQEWDNKQFEAVNKQIKSYDYEVNIDTNDLQELKKVLSTKTDFLVRLFENPILLEHETFTELLRSVFHLADELANRKDLSTLPLSDKQHLRLDVQRAYKLLADNWLVYMNYLKNNHMYLFSLAMRTNPFSEESSSIVT